MSIKSIAKHAIFNTLLGSEDKIVIASTGRAGSTMLFDAVVSSYISRRFHQDANGRLGRFLCPFVSRFVDRLDTLATEPCVIAKTHDLPGAMNDHGVKCIFVYGDPLESALSVWKMVEKHGEDWFALHQFHLCASGPLDQIFQADVLNYDQQMRQWLGTVRANVLCIDYEDLWKSEQLISQFLGVNVSLPARQSRVAKGVEAPVNEALFEQLRALKRELKAQYVSKDVRLGGVES